MTSGLEDPQDGSRRRLKDLKKVSQVLQSVEPRYKSDTRQRSVTGLAVSDFGQGPSIIVWAKISGTKKAQKSSRFQLLENYQYRYSF